MRFLDWRKDLRCSRGADATDESCRTVLLAGGIGDRKVRMRTCYLAKY